MERAHRPGAPRSSDSGSGSGSDSGSGSAVVSRTQSTRHAERSEPQATGVEASPSPYEARTIHQVVENRGHAPFKTPHFLWSEPRLMSEFSVHASRASGLCVGSVHRPCRRRRPGCSRTWIPRTRWHLGSRSWCGATSPPAARPRRRGSVRRMWCGATRWRSSWSRRSGCPEGAHPSSAASSRSICLR